MTPITRQEMFLNAAAGNEQALPDPITREEMFLKAIADNAGSGGGGGGGGGGVLVVSMDTSTGALDKTWQEIHDADLAVVKIDDNGTIYVEVLTPIGHDDSVYYVGNYAAQTANDYPVVYNVGGGGGGVV